MTAISIVSTTRVAVSATPAAFTPSLGADPNVLNSPRPLTVRLWSDTPVNIRVDGSDATFDDLALASGMDGLLIAVPVGQSVSAVKQAGAADGSLWASVVRRQ